MAEFFSRLWNSVVVFFSSINIFTSILDILLVAFLIYALIQLVRDSRAEQLLKGIALLVIVYLLSSWLQLKALHFLMQTLFDNGLILLAVVFQPELRRALERAGNSRSISGTLSRLSLSADDPEQSRARWQHTIAAVCSAAEQLQRMKMGALIVFERTTKLGEIVRTGTVLDADASAELIGNVFFNKAPLHDGAMILRDGKVYAAGCILPLTDNQRISSELGTRHRAAVGMSENSDALVVVVSEETGAISLATAGVLKRDFSIEALRVALENGMLLDAGGQRESKGLGLFKRRKSK